MYNPSPYSPRQEVTTPDAVSNPRCLRAHGFTAALPDTRYPASGKILKQLRVAARIPKASESKGPGVTRARTPPRRRARFALSQRPDTTEDQRPPPRVQVPFRPCPS